MAANLLNEHKNNIRSLEIIPSSGGVFEVINGSKVLFSKKESGRFPEDDEVENLLRKTAGS